VEQVRRRAPSVGKGKKFPFQTAIACWIDLLGYGEMIGAAGFNPLHPKSIDARKRLRTFHEIVAAGSARPYPSLVLNDGAVCYRDLSYRSASVTFDFLQRSWKLFNSIHDAENEAGHPGARMVLATGFRIRGRRGGMDSTADQFRSLVSRLDNGVITIEQALHEARQIRPSFDIVPHLQANFAFTKAYLADHSGKRGGLGGAKCYIDLAIFEGIPSGWIKLGRHVRWKSVGKHLEATFAPLLKMKAWGRAEPHPPEIRDGLRVAQHLAGDSDVLGALRLAGGSGR
jgi:hypothetical protein